jgi:hypothetical protein
MLLMGLIAALSSTAQAQEVPVETGYKKGFYVSQGDNFLVKFGGRVQPRFVFEANEDFSDTEQAFEVTRARFKMSGHAFSPKAKYAFQLDAGKGFVSLKDYFIDGYIGDSNVFVRAGQAKIWASRQQMASTADIQMVERAVTDKYYGYGRDTGLAVYHQMPRDGGIEWVLGVYNGTGDKGVFSGETVVDLSTGEGEVEGKYSNVPGKMLPKVAATLGWANSGDVIKEVDHKPDAPLRFGVGGSVVAALDNDGGDDGSVVANLDYMVKHRGVTHTSAVYLGMVQDGGSWTSQAYESLGFHTQVGYNIAGKVQPAVLYAMILPSQGDSTSEVGLGVNGYWHKDNWKLQADVNRQQQGAEVGYIARSQIQLSF